MNAPKRKKDHYPSAILALISMILGFLFLVLWIFGSAYWLHQFIRIESILFYGYLLFSGIAIVLGLYSLFIQRSIQAWLAVIGGTIFILLLLLVLYLMKDFCVVC